MKKTFLALLMTALIASVVPGAETHAKVPLAPSNDSHVSGFVEITQLPQGGSDVSVVVTKGLTPGQVYASFYYESSDCTEPADLLGTFVGRPSRGGQIQGKIDDDLDEVGSVSVRIGPGYGTLLGCATVH
ncbi:MAG: hypothetical protein E6K78_06985 [Candidatus Eisenbacteria bacterium]|uniref:Uncharacterized protein n=1 Tax=Eiseniibacteriota bacterium TaxID=2212470 RepID=A0A538TQE6_UNCEI|nr:MAG: hypothetical protein E6K78_06985 [Candidatus Eisenbacteria bacterium]